MKCPHCGNLLTPSKMAVDNHYKKYHPEQYEIMKQKSIAAAEKHGRIGFSREKYTTEADKYLIEKCSALQTQRIKAAQDKQNGVKHSRAGTTFGYGA